MRAELAAIGDGRTPGLSASLCCVFFFTMSPKRLPSPPYNPGVRDLVEGKRAGSHPLTKNEIERGFLGWHENGYLRIGMNMGLASLSPSGWRTPFQWNCAQSGKRY